MAHDCLVTAQVRIFGNPPCSPPDAEAYLAWRAEDGRLMTVLLGTGLPVGGLQALRLRDVKRNQIHVSWESAKGEKAMRVGAVPNHYRRN